MSKARKQTPFYRLKEVELLDGNKEMRWMPRNRAAIREYYSNKQVNKRKPAQEEMFRKINENLEIQRLYKERLDSSKETGDTEVVNDK